MSMPDEDPRLSPHLIEVARLLAERKTNQEIADALCIGLHTTENYVGDLKRSLGARDRVDLVFRCQQRSWLI